MMDNPAVKTEDGMRSRRVAKRVGCNLPARITFNGVYLCDGIIKDISTSGLRLFIPNKAWLPHQFEVVTPELGKPIAVKTNWTNGDRVGVEFVFGGS